MLCPGFHNNGFNNNDTCVPPALSVTTIIAATTDVITSTSTIIPLLDFQEVYGPSTCMPATPVPNVRSTTVYTDPTGAADAVGVCANVCAGGLGCIAFLVYHTDPTYTCVL
jgi:hypothetical protein